MSCVGVELGLKTPVALTRLRELERRASTSLMVRPRPLPHHGSPVHRLADEQARGVRLRAERRR